MVHIFRINNYTSYLISKLIIDKYQLKKEQCIFFCDRNLKVFKEDEEYAIENPFQIEDDPFPISKNILIMWRARKKFDQFLEKLIKKQVFSFYGYNFSKTVNQLFITHPHCERVYMVEEGMACYKGKKFLLNSLKWTPSFKRRILLYLGYLGRRKTYGTAIDNCNTYFSLSDFAYSGFNPVINVFDKKKMAETCSKGIIYDLPKKSFIIVMDASSSIGLVKISNYKMVLRKVLEKISNSPQSIALKFHPDQSNEERNSFLEIISKFDIKIIADNIPLEYFVFNENEYFFVGNRSSILFYAGLNKKHSYTFQNLLEYTPNEFEIPEIFFKYVKDFSEFQKIFE